MTTLRCKLVDSGGGGRMGRKRSTGLIGQICVRQKRSEEWDLESLDPLTWPFWQNRDGD